SHEYLALRLTPIGEMSRHVRQVRVLLAVESGFIVRMELTDADEDRTVISFSDIHTNVGLSEADVELKLPEDVKVTHPLAGLESEGS
ncbi:MAG TPA: hypothetical protein VG722_02155, partial [Tepidisphaeraceae bacterium]|nr:hypothetical protein [Tepidisphaeraceae bacterium]